MVPNSNLGYLAKSYWSKRKTPYEKVQDIIVSLYRENDRRLVKENEVIEKLKVTPGLFLPGDTTWQDVLEGIEKLGWISRVKPLDLEERVVLPLIDLNK